MSPFVYIDYSEDAELEEGDVLPIEEADPLFRSLDQNQVMDRTGYNKTQFEVWYQMNGECSSYEGRQDFGDGEGSLLNHIDAFQRYYLETEDGARMLEYMGKERAQRMIEGAEYVRDTLLPFLKYYCNLYEIEKALKEEQENNKKVPVIYPFARYEYYNPQEKGEGRQTMDPRTKVSMWTAGLNWYALPNLVVKADYSTRKIGGGKYNSENEFSLAVAYVGWFLSK